MDGNHEPLNVSDVNLDKHIEEIFRHLNEYDAIVVETQNEAKLLRDENRGLKESLNTIIEEHNQFVKSREANESLDAFRMKYFSVADNIFNNLRNQTFLIYKEKEMFEDLCKRLLQGQSQINSIPELKAEYNFEINRLKEEVITATRKCEDQKKINSALQANRKEIIERLESLHKLNNESIEKLKRSEVEKTKMVKFLDESSVLNRLQIERSTESFSKLQEAIKVADEALAEIELLRNEKQQIESECNNLAQTISYVMERASDKVAKDFEDLKMERQRDQERFSQEIERLKEAVEAKEAERVSALQQVEVLKDKLKSIEDVIGQDVAAAFQTIVANEKKFLSMKQAIEKERRVNMASRHEIETLRKVNESSRQVKQKWKSLLLQLTKRLEEQITKILLDNNNTKCLK